MGIIASIITGHEETVLYLYVLTAKKKLNSSDLKYSFALKSTRPYDGQVPYKSTAKYVDYHQERNSFIVTFLIKSTN